MNDAARLTTDDIPGLMIDIGRRARAAGRILALAPAADRKSVV